MCVPVVEVKWVLISCSGRLITDGAAYLLAVTGGHPTSTTSPGLTLYLVVQL